MIKTLIVSILSKLSFNFLFANDEKYKDYELRTFGLRGRFFKTRY